VAAFETLLTEDRGAVRVVTVNRPGVLNALNGQVVAELSRCVEEAAEEPKVRGLVVTGAGDKSFISGADIAAMAEMTPHEALAFAGAGHALGEMLSTVAMPTVAAVNGFALGGGCEVALACDFIYASKNARFGQPEVKLGIIPGFGGTQRLARRVGRGRALEMCMTGDPIKAEEAHRIGLVNRVLSREELVPAAVETAERICERGPVAIARVKEVLHRGVEMPLEDANQMEAEAFASLFLTEDQREGMAAFLDKRPAQFRGK
jgi:enoyl-CoA hydratase